MDEETCVPTWFSTRRSTRDAGVSVQNSTYGRLCSRKWEATEPQLCFSPRSLCTALLPPHTARVRRYPTLTKDRQSARICLSSAVLSSSRKSRHFNTCRAMETQRTALDLTYVLCEFMRAPTWHAETDYDLANSDDSDSHSSHVLALLTLTPILLNVSAMF